MKLTHKCATCVRTIPYYVWQCSACIRLTELQCLGCARPFEVHKFFGHLCYECWVKLLPLNCLDCAESFSGPSRFGEPGATRFRVCDDCWSDARCCEICFERKPSGVSRTCRPCVEKRQAAMHGDPGKIAPAQRRQIWVGKECVYCGYPAEAADHVRPLEHGGRNEPSNLVPACQYCNSSKGPLLLAEWAKWSRENVLRAAQVSDKVRAELVRLDYEPLPVAVELCATHSQRCGGNECMKRIEVFLVCVDYEGFPTVASLCRECANRESRQILGRFAGWEAAYSAKNAHATRVESDQANA